MGLELTEIELRVAAAGAVRDAGLRAPGAAGRRRGVVHTPPELARHLACAADGLLRARLGLEGGLSDGRVLVVDPACGPGAFLAAVLAVGRPPFDGGVPRMVGLDLDADAIRSARRSLGPAARERGWRLTLLCADTLGALTLRSSRARTLVVLANPPWSSRATAARAGPIEPLMNDFRVDDRGQPLGERKLGVLADDYVRFWRWACEVARRASAGAVVAMVTNGSFLDGPVHRGMRAALLRWFEGLHILDLGGSALVARATGPDENVFGVRPSVAITLAWRSAAAREPLRARVAFARLRGRRRDKLRALLASAPPSEQFLDCVPPAFLFRPSSAVHGSYATWPSLAEAMPFHREGVQTNRDAVVVDRDRDRLLERLGRFAAGSRDADLAVAWRPLRHYDPARARSAVARALSGDPGGEGRLALRRIAYRPLDDRWFAPLAPLCHRPRPALLDAIDVSSAVLLTVRKDRGETPWMHFGATTFVPDNCWLSSRSSCRTRAFPARMPDGTANLDRLLARRWSDELGVEVEVEGFLPYALGVLAAACYRHAFDAALRTDYPRIPPPPNAAAYVQIGEAGRALTKVLAQGSLGRVGPATALGHWDVMCSGLSAAIAQASDAVARSMALGSVS